MTIDIIIGLLKQTLIRDLAQRFRPKPVLNMLKLKLSAYDFEA